MTARLLALAAVLALPIHARADWTHFRGPAQNGIAAESGWNAQLPATGPHVLWRASLGIGTSSVTISGDHAYSAGNADGKDTIWCLDVKSGKEVWRLDYPLAVDANMFEGGPRATPTIDGGHVYAVSHQGDVWCLDAATGKKVWYKHYQKDFGGRRPQWGYAGSPTVDGRLVFLDTGARGASTVALDKATGAVVWKSGSDEAGYASPVVATIGGRKTVVMFKATHLVGLEAASGKELWRSEWRTDYDVNAATPLVIGDQILISSGYNHGAALISIANGKAKEVWMNKSLRAQFNSPVVVQGTIFGIDNNVGKGPLVALDLASGEVKWTEKSVRGGSLIAADGKLIVVTEGGELVIADASPAGFRALARAPVGTKRNWVEPTLSAGRLFVKNNAGDLVVLDLGAK